MLTLADEPLFFVFDVFLLCPWRSGVSATAAAAAPRMDFGELDGIMQNILSPAGEATSEGECTFLPLHRNKKLKKLKTDRKIITSIVGPEAGHPHLHTACLTGELRIMSCPASYSSSAPQL